MQNVFYRARHRRGIKWAELYERSARPLTWWQSCLVGSVTGLALGLVIACCFLIA